MACARAFQRHRRVFGVRAHQRDRLRLRVHPHRGVEESLRPADRGIRPRGHDLEVAVVLELGIDVQAEQPDQQELALHRDRHGRGDDVGPVSRHDQVHLVHVEQLGVDARHRGGVGLVVVVNELDLAPEDAALGIDVVAPDLHRDQRRLAVARERAGEAHAEADLERLLRQRRSRGRKQRGRQQSCQCTDELHLPLPCRNPDECWYAGPRSVNQSAALPAGARADPCAPGHLIHSETAS